ncbi:hypothetical protein QWY85_20600 [Neolewinella lacunae]|uniref:Uncharacterized protein n=1 Tax=Neolewinella lacunae TaxID=1517758 RepID=A0A923PLG8_9BACT|nr:hypothetical protein [Neolewinella lacunae]MBC6993856.1 hypothetical protein [Neolewinella lacunae]MDN3637083.1 hypothetical protein [Neolewinella lacunae]
MRNLFVLLLFLSLCRLPGQELPRISDLITSLGCDEVECFTLFAEQHQCQLVSQSGDLETLEAAYLSSVSYPAFGNPDVLVADSLFFLYAEDSSMVAMITSSLEEIQKILPELDQELNFKEVASGPRGSADPRTYRSEKFPAIVLRLIFYSAMQEGQKYEILKVELTEIK